MAEEMIGDHHMKSAELWVKVAEEKQALSYEEEESKILQKLKEEIEVFKLVEEGLHLYENLCKKLETTGHYENFKSSSTSCRYIQERGNPFLLRKLEELNQDPVVNIIHNFLSKEEVDDILEKSENYKFLPTPPNIYQLPNARARTSFFVEEQNDSLGKLTKELKMRMSRLTGINMDHSEELEILKYRPGGSHLPHVDYHTPLEVLLGYSVKHGNRFNQGILFLSETELGGNFAMPFLGIAVVPRPGSLVVYHNTDRYGHLDPRSFHGGCKVFKGNKLAGVFVSKALDQNNVQSRATQDSHQLGVGRKYLTLGSDQNLYRAQHFLTKIFYT